MSILVLYRVDYSIIKVKCILYIMIQFTERRGLKQQFHCAGHRTGEHPGAARFPAASTQPQAPASLRQGVEDVSEIYVL